MSVLQPSDILFEYPCSHSSEPGSQVLSVTFLWRPLLQPWPRTLTRPHSLKLALDALIVTCRGCTPVHPVWGPHVISNEQSSDEETQQSTNIQDWGRGDPNHV